MEILINQENELPTAASSLLKFAGNRKIFLFHGEMGVGKTTLIKSLCLQLGMVDNVSSPTYSIVNEYVFPEGRIFHFDFFRIKNETEAFDIGLEEYLMSGEYCFIEWPEMIAGLWPQNYTEIKLVENENGVRQIFAKNI
jgi:tRNA threonylcarbamoyladenosine biosynthesis protein TsaE